MTFPRYFSKTILLFTLAQTTILFGMNELYPLSFYVDAATFNRNNPQQITLLSSHNRSIIQWDTENNTLSTHYIEALDKELDQKKIHSISYTNDSNYLEII